MSDRFLHVPGGMKRHLALRILATAVFLGGNAAADTVTVRYPEGLVHGFLALRTLSGETLADGDLIQTSRDDQVISRLVFRFRDGSLHDETTVFTQKGTFQLLREKLIQRGPSFETPIDATVDATSGRIQIKYKDKKGVEKLIDEKIDVPAGLSNGLLPTLLKNVAPTASRVEFPMIAIAPKPRLVRLVATPAGEDPFQIGGSARKAKHYVVKVELGGVAGVIAPLIGKQPPDMHVWILEGEAPAFLKSEGPLAPEGPVWRIELVSPVFPDATPASGSR